MSSTKTDLDIIRDLLKLPNPKEKICRLECVSGSSNKFYEIYIERNKGKEVVVAQYGAMGTSPRRMEYDPMVRRVDGSAEALAETLLTAKLKKGYRLINGKQ